MQYKSTAHVYKNVEIKYKNKYINTPRLKVGAVGCFSNERTHLYTDTNTHTVIVLV